MNLETGAAALARMMGALVVSVGALVGPVRAEGQVDELVRRGSVAVTMSEFTAAAEAFAEALKLDPTNLRAVHGQAVCQYQEGDVPGALASMKTVVAQAGDNADRAMVLNLMALYIHSEQPMDGVRLCQAYLTRRSDPLDEAMLTALGSALVAAAEGNQGKPEWDKAGQFYNAYCAKLEKANPGMKRWGEKWITAEEHAVLTKDGEVPRFPGLFEMVAIDDLTPPPIARGPTDHQQPGDPANIVEQLAAQHEAIAIPISPDLLLTPLASVKSDMQVHVESPQSVTYVADVIRTDAAKGLALLKVRNAKLQYLNLAEKFDGGPVQCAAVTQPVVFGIVPKVVAGTTKAPSAQGWTVHLEEMPKLPGSPLTSGGMVVGIALVGSRSDDLEVPSIPLQDIRQFVGKDMPKPSRSQIEPKLAVYHVVAKSK